MLNLEQLKKRELDKANNKKSLIKWSVIFGITIILLGGMLIKGKFSLTDFDDKLPDNSKYVSDGSLNNLSEEEIRQKLQQKAEASEFAIQISSELYFPHGTLNKGSVRIENPANNNYNAVVKLYRNDINELIYTSPTLSPAQFIEYTPLDVKLDAGKYPVTALFIAYDGAAEVGRVQVQSTLIVE